LSNCRNTQYLPRGLLLLAGLTAMLPAPARVEPGHGVRGDAWMQAINVGNGESSWSQVDINKLCGVHEFLFSTLLQKKTQRLVVISEICVRRST
jgi:hypothetical protein